MQMIDEDFCYGEWGDKKQKVTVKSVIGKVWDINMITRNLKL